MLLPHDLGQGSMPDSTEPSLSGFALAVRQGRVFISVHSVAAKPNSVDDGPHESHTWNSSWEERRPLYRVGISCSARLESQGPISASLYTQAASLLTT